MLPQWFSDLAGPWWLAWLTHEYLSYLERIKSKSRLSKWCPCRVAYFDSCSEKNQLWCALLSLPVLTRKLFESKCSPECWRIWTATCWIWQDCVCSLRANMSDNRRVLQIFFAITHIDFLGSSLMISYTDWINTDVFINYDFFNTENTLRPRPADHVWILNTKYLDKFKHQTISETLILGVRDTNILWVFISCVKQEAAFLYSWQAWKWIKNVDFWYVPYKITFNSLLIVPWHIMIMF